MMQLKVTVLQNSHVVWYGSTQGNCVREQLFSMAWSTTSHTCLDVCVVKVNVPELDRHC